MALKRVNKNKELKSSIQLDVYLVDRKEVIQAVAKGTIPIEAVSINFWKLKQWAEENNFSEGTINGVKITERKKG